MSSVARGIPQLAAREVRRHDGVVPAFEMQVAHVVLELLAEDPALGMPDGQTRAELLGEREQVELAAELAMVALLGLLQAVQVRAQLLRRGPRRAVDPGEHRPRLVPAPVRARELHQLERLQTAGRGHVRTQAQVGPALVAVDRDRVAGGDLALLERLDDLALVGLIRETLERVGARNLLAHERLIGVDELAHAVLDLREVGLGDRTRQLEVVVEAVLDGRADRVSGAGPQVAHGLRQHVRRRMPQDVETVGVGRQDRLHLPVGHRHERKIDELAVHPGRDGLGRQHGTDRLPFGEFGGGAVGELDPRHGTAMISAAPGPIRTRSRRAR